MNSDLLYLYIPLLFSGFVISLLIIQSLRHERALSQKDRLLEQLLDRLMSRDLGEFEAVRQERERPVTPRPPEYLQTEEENVLAFQAMGDEWRDPSELADRYVHDYMRSVRPE